MNLTQPITGRELVNFKTFDQYIEEAVNAKSMYANRLINQEDVPSIVAGLREWLIRRAGPLTVIGYYRPPNLNIWFDNEALIEEFDDLLLKFREYLKLEKAIELDGEYSLLRYRDSVNFIMFAGTPLTDITDTLGAPDGNGFILEDDEDMFKYALEDANRFIEEMISRMNDKFDALYDARPFVEDLIGGRLEEVLRKHICK